MIEFLRQNARVTAMFLVAIATFLFGDVDFSSLDAFLTSLFAESGFFLAALVTTIFGFVGEKRLLKIESNTLLTTAVAVIGFLLPSIAPGVDWTSLLNLLGNLAANGELLLGGVVGVIINYFGDIRVGRPVEEGVPSNRYTGDNQYRMSHLVPIILYGRRYKRAA